MVFLLLLFILFWFSSEFVFKLLRNEDVRGLRTCEACRPHSSCLVAVRPYRESRSTHTAGIFRGWGGGTGARGGGGSGRTGAAVLPAPLRSSPVARRAGPEMRGGRGKYRSLPRGTPLSAAQPPPHPSQPLPPLPRRRHWERGPFKSPALPPGS